MPYDSIKSVNISFKFRDLTIANTTFSTTLKIIFEGKSFEFDVGLLLVI